MIASSASDAEIHAVFSRVAPERAAELTATAWHDSPARLAEELVLLRYSYPQRPQVPLWALFGSEPRPAAIVGVLPFGPGIGGMVWVATPEWAPIALSSHRWWRKFFVPEVLGTFRRVEFTALAADRESRRWLSGLGFTEEGIAYRQGKRGEDFVHCAWVNPDRTVGVSR